MYLDQKRWLDDKEQSFICAQSVLILYSEAWFPSPCCVVFYM